MSWSRENTRRGLRGEEAQQIELLRRQAQLPPALARPLACAASICDVAELEAPGIARGCRRAAQNRPHADRELARRERLRHVVVGAELEADDPVGLLAARRQQDHRQVGARADPAAELEPVDAGEHHVEHDERRRSLLEQLARGVAVARLERRRTRPA